LAHGAERSDLLKRCAGVLVSCGDIEDGHSVEHMTEAAPP